MQNLVEFIYPMIIILFVGYIGSLYLTILIRLRTHEVIYSTIYKILLIYTIYIFAFPLFLFEKLLMFTFSSSLDDHNIKKLALHQRFKISINVIIKLVSRPKGNLDNFTQFFIEQNIDLSNFKIGFKPMSSILTSSVNSKIKNSTKRHAF